MLFQHYHIMHSHLEAIDFLLEDEEFQLFNRSSGKQFMFHEVQRAAHVFNLKVKDRFNLSEEEDQKAETFIIN